MFDRRSSFERIVVHERNTGSPGPRAGRGPVQRDLAPGGAVLASFLEDTAGDDDRYRSATDDELLGVICAWDRVEANASAGKHAAVAELMRWPFFCLMMKVWMTGRNFWRKPSSGRACTAV